MENNLKSTLSQHFKDQEGCAEYDLNENISNYSDNLIKFFELLIEADIKIKKNNNKDKVNMV
jgi:hypothetical protein